jgi:hypothetical protein
MIVPIRFAYSTGGALYGTWRVRCPQRSRSISRGHYQVPRLRGMRWNNRYGGAALVIYPHGHGDPVDGITRQQCRNGISAEWSLLGCNAAPISFREPAVRRFRSGRRTFGRVPVGRQPVRWHFGNVDGVKGQISEAASRRVRAQPADERTPVSTVNASTWKVIRNTPRACKRFARWCVSEDKRSK